jgi:hypothetical protein
MSKHHDDAESQAPNPDSMATKLFIYTLLGVIAYAAAAIIFIEVLAP